MSSGSVALPAVSAMLAGLAAVGLQRRLRPALAALLLTVVAGVAALAASLVVLLLAVAFVGQLIPVAEDIGWCPPLLGDHRLPAWLGAAALAASVAMIGSSALAARRLLRHRSDDGGGLVVLPTDAPTAFALPGRPGQVVVSTGMLRQLDPDERRVLLAHEQSHLRRHHHRYVWIGTLAAAAAPVLRPVLAGIRFATERWADEDAAREVGDRRLVARTIARAALAEVPAPGMALAGLGVRARVDALVAGPPSAPALSWALIGAVAIAVTVVGSAGLQVHHIAEVVARLCR